MIDINNDAKFQKYIGMVLDKVIDEMSKDVLNIVKDYIVKDVYAKDMPHIYPTSYQFIDSWIAEKEKSGATGEAVAEIFSDANLMKYEKVTITTDNRTRDVWMHGSPDYGDLRAEMSEIIENGTKYYYPKIRKDGTWNPAAKKRPFFQDTIKYLDSRGRLWKMFEEKMNKYGLTVQKTGTTNI